MPKLTVDGLEVEVPAGATVLQACEAAGVEIPRFCYHERLSIAGNCRMCLVEMEKAPKPVASCAMPASDGMVIKTNTPTVHKARRGVMEFLLINHPLDCPICDQGGECDLQDQAIGFGYDRGRYLETKRAVKDKDFGPLVRTEMTRCIHCTRCVRFSAEVAGVPELGAIGRGEHMEIGTYVAKAISSELSGNLVDLCPVGALTSKPYAFTARPWELKRTESIDVLDALGSNIRVDARGGQVMRVTPRLNDAINEEWISDKTRFACDGLSKRRLDRPYVRGADGKLAPASWTEAFNAIASKLRGTAPSRMAAIAGDLVDCESVLALKELLGAWGVENLDCRQDGAKIGGPRAGWLFNSGIAGIDQADAILIVGADPRHDAPVLNARIRRRYLTGKLSVGIIGAATDQTYRFEAVGTGPEALTALANGSHPFAATLQAAQKPMIIVGMDALTRPDGTAVLVAAASLAEQVGAVVEGWNGFNVLHRAGGRVGALELGFLPGPQGRDLEGILAGASSGDIDFVWLLGADEFDTSRLGKAFTVYQGHHGDAGAARADVILPGAAYTEKNATYVNTEGRPQRAKLAVFPPGDAREDWKIIRALAGTMGVALPFDTLEQLRARMVAVAPHLAAIDQVQPAAWGPLGPAGSFDAAPFAAGVQDFYRTDPISRASETMDACSALYVRGEGAQDQQAVTGTHG